MTDWNLLKKRLQKSEFRSRFRLNQEAIDYINEKGIITVSRHARDFIINRIAPEVIKNDGKQTPWKGHPVFIAQHATATCCRKCIEKWYSIKRNTQLTESQIEFLHFIIMSWIKEQLV